MTDDDIFRLAAETWHKIGAALRKAEEEHDLTKEEFLTLLLRNLQHLRMYIYRTRDAVKLETGDGRR